MLEGWKLNCSRWDKFHSQYAYIDGFDQDCSNSSGLAMKLLQFYTTHGKPYLISFHFLNALWWCLMHWLDRNKTRPLSSPLSPWVAFSGPVSWRCTGIVTSSYLIVLTRVNWHKIYIVEAQDYRPNATVQAKKMLPSGGRVWQTAQSR